jgi:hypothetical protein
MNGDTHMLGFLLGWWRGRAVRPLLWWVLALLLYVVLPVPSSLVLLLVVGLGVALTMTIQRLREGARQAVDVTARTWGLAERLASAVEDRIRYSGAAPSEYGPAVVPQLAPAPVAYDPGALLSAVVAVLSAEGIVTNAGAALPACAQLLAWQQIAAVPGAPAPTAYALATTLAPGPLRYSRVVPVGVVAACIRVVLVTDGVMPSAMPHENTGALLEATRLLMEALGVTPEPGTGSPEAWPVMADVIRSAVRDGGQWS